MNNKQIKFRVYNFGNMIYPNKFGFDNMGFTYNLPYDDNEYRVGNLKLVMQFIGIKDKTGKEIYENDIIKEKHFEDWGDEIGFDYVGIIKWSSKTLSFVSYCDDKEITYNSYSGNKITSYCEIIGNIYETPYLLK